jgi:hypothetical protein
MNKIVLFGAIFCLALLASTAAAQQPIPESCLLEKETITDHRNWEFRHGVYVNRGQDLDNRGVAIVSFDELYIVITWTRGTESPPIEILGLAVGTAKINRAAHTATFTYTPIKSDCADLRRAVTKQVESSYPKREVYW